MRSPAAHSASTYAAVRRTALWAGALALLLQVLAWSLALPVRGADGTWTVICTPAGLTEVLVGADGTVQDRDQPAPAASADSCPLCPVVGGMAVPPPLLLVAAPQPQPGHDPVALPGAHIAAGWFLSSLQARAPPVPA